jgi:hypothetical protein
MAGLARLKCNPGCADVWREANFFHFVSGLSWDQIEISSPIFFPP